MSDLLATDSVFTAEEQALLRRILDAMIPAHGERPSAADPAIFADFLHTAAPMALQIREVLRRAEADGIDTLAGTRTNDVRMLVGCAVQSYYRDDRVLTAIGAEPRAPHPEGYEIEAGDWSLLDAVRARGPIYREV